MRVVVLGAGILGVSSAWYLHRAGHEVAVVDRQPASAMETSFANGGQRSTGHVEPWASPDTLPRLLWWMTQESAPMLFRLRADPAQWRWALSFFSECRPSRQRHNLRQLLNLGLYSRQAQDELQAALPLPHEEIRRGILHLYDNQKEWEEACRTSARITQLGYERYRVTLQEAMVLEPSLQYSSAHWVGGTYTPGDCTGNAHLWTQALARHCEQAGVRFLFGQVAESLITEGNRICAVRLTNEPLPLETDAVVVALGSHSVSFLQPLGLRLPIYPVKGYSATLPVLEQERAPTIGVTDDASKMVFTLMGNKLRIAGTAELNSYDMTLSAVRCNALTERARILFPEAADYARPEYWTGLRPATPSGCPLIGRWRYCNLFLNTGHGSLGWTLGCGSGKALALLVSGEPTGLDFSFSRP